MMVDLPQPEWPTSATRSPCLTASWSLRSTGWSGRAGYANPASSNSMYPFSFCSYASQLLFGLNKYKNITTCFGDTDLYVSTSVHNLVSQVRDVVLMNVYLDLGNSGRSGFWNGGYMNKGREMERSVYEQPGNEVDGSCNSKEGSK